MWSTYMGHVATVDRRRERRSQERPIRAASVYRVVPKAKQKAALAFLERERFRDARPGSSRRTSCRGIGPNKRSRRVRRRSSRRSSTRGATGTSRRSRGVSIRRTPYPLAEYLGDLKADVSSTAATPRCQSPRPAARVRRATRGDRQSAAGAGGSARERAAGRRDRRASRHRSSPRRTCRAAISRRSRARSCARSGDRGASRAASATACRREGALARSCRPRRRRARGETPMIGG